VVVASIAELDCYMECPYRDAGHDPECETHIAQHDDACTSASPHLNHPDGTLRIDRGTGRVVVEHQGEGTELAIIKGGVIIRR